MIAQTARDNLIKLAKAYAKATGKSFPQISKKFYGKMDFFDSFISKQSTISIDKFEEVVNKFRELWPEGAEWPPLRAIVIPRKK